jgi:hypothetical protein
MKWNGNTAGARPLSSGRLPAVCDPASNPPFHLSATGETSCRPNSGEEAPHLPILYAIPRFL